MKASVNSRYYLYVKFKPEYSMRPSGSFTYNSNDGQGPEQALFKLEVRLSNLVDKNGTVTYLYAKIVDRHTNNVILIADITGVHQQAAYQKMKNERSGSSVLKAQIILKPRMMAYHKKNDLPAKPIIVRSTETVDQWGQSGLDVALMGILDEIESGGYRYNFDMVHLYWHPGNHRVGEINDMLNVTLFNNAFREQLLAAGSISRKNLRLVDQTVSI